MSCRMCRMILKRSSFSLCGFCLCLGSWWSCRDDAFSCELFSWLYLIDIPSTATFNMVSELTVNTLYQQKSLTLHCFPPRSLNFTNKYFSRNSNERTLCYQNKSWFERRAQSPKFSGKSNELFWKVLIRFLMVILVFSPGFSVFVVGVWLRGDVREASVRQLSHVEGQSRHTDITVSWPTYTALLNCWWQ